MTGTIKAITELLLRLLNVVLRYLQKREKEKKEDEAQERMDKASNSPGAAMSDKFGGMQSLDFQPGNGDNAAEATDPDDQDTGMAGRTGGVDRGRDGGSD